MKGLIVGQKYLFLFISNRTTLKQKHCVHIGKLIEALLHSASGHQRSRTAPQAGNLLVSQSQMIHLLTRPYDIATITISYGRILSHLYDIGTVAISYV